MREWDATYSDFPAPALVANLRSAAAMVVKWMKKIGTA